MDVSGVATLPVPPPAPAVAPVPAVDIPAATGSPTEQAGSGPSPQLSTGAGYTAAEIALAGRTTAYLTAVAVAADLTFDGYI